MARAEVTKILTDREMEVTASGSDILPGEVVVAGHKVGVSESLQPIADGETGVIRVVGFAYLPAASATTFAQGANVQFNTTTRLAVPSGGTHSGRAVYAKTNGQDGVWVELNETAS